jgi:hypothetical protein
MALAAGIAPLHGDAKSQAAANITAAHNFPELIDVCRDPWQRR